jgi:hypothetical protein
MALSDISNGIWMCYRHGKLIDTDENTYSVSMLQTWRKLAEVRASVSQSLGRDVDLTPQDLTEVPLPTFSVSLGVLGTENATIGDAISNSCLESLWGRDLAHAVRDAAIELSRNALTHGAANNVEFKIEASFVEIVDDGVSFSAETLLAQPIESGGVSSIARLKMFFKSKVIFVSSRTDSKNSNRISLLRTPEDIERVSPCTVRLAPREMSGRELRVESLESCTTIYLLLPLYLAYSDIRFLPRYVANILPKNKHYVIVGNDLSDGVIEACRNALPNIDIINF